MTAGKRSVVLEALSGPLDGASLSVDTRAVGLDAADPDMLMMPGYVDLAEAEIRLSIEAGDRISVTAKKPLTINDGDVGRAGDAAVGDVIGVGVAELLIVGIAEAFGGAAMTGDQHEAGSATTPAPTAGETECSHCGALNSPQAPWCSGCGRDL